MEAFANEWNEMNQSPWFYWPGGLRAAHPADGTAWGAHARTHARPVLQACPQISMSGGPLSSARYWLAALGSVRVSTSQEDEQGVEEEGGGKLI